MKPKEELNVLVYGEVITDIIVPYADTLRFVDGMRTDPDKYKGKIAPQVTFNLGGGGGNSASIFSALGVKTRFMSRVGNCALSSLLEEKLKAQGIDTSCIKHEDQPMILMMGILGEGGSRTMIPAPIPGCSTGGFDPEDFNPEYLNGADCLYICGTQLIFHVNEIPMISEYAKLARSKGILVCIDLNVRPETQPVTEQKRKDYQELLTNVDIVFGSVDDEFTVLADNYDIDAAIERFSTKENIIVARDGENPVILVDHGVKSVHSVPRVENVISTIGAGDTASASFVVDYLQHRDAIRSVKVSNAVTGYAISHSEPHAVPSDDELQKMIV